MNEALSQGLAHDLQIEAPYAKVSKAEVIRRGAALDLPLELTLSCMSPVTRADGARHCGLCSKCRERHDAFLEAGAKDPTDYADLRFVR
jgi:7-cyano-7-deazaguanine synthase